MSVCVARQPIFNKNMQIYAYELLYRSSAASVAYDGVDGDVASSSTITNSFHQIGMDKVTGGKRAFVNFTEKLIVDRVPTLMPNNILVVEILETVSVTEDILAACAELKNKNYTIALDDFVLTDEFEPLLKYADIIKVDFLSTELPDLLRIVTAARKHNIVLLAEKVENQDVFELSKRLGFSLFQGYFFSKPTIVADSTKTVSPMKLNCLQLIRLIFDPNADFMKIAEIIKKDVALSYGLLRVINSAFFGLNYTVNNIMQALAILGMDEIKKWITLVSMAEIKSGKPDELLRMSLIRGKFMELLASKAGFGSRSDDMFMVGLMSLIDVIMDSSFEEIIVSTHLSPAIAEAIVNKTGEYGKFLQVVIQYEQCKFDEALEMLSEYNIDEGTMSKCYLDAIEWGSLI